jgi:hypothetical protein
VVETNASADVLVYDLQHAFVEAANEDTARSSPGANCTGFQLPAAD